MSLKHLGGCIINNHVGDVGSWTPEIWNKIIEDYKPKSIIDVGCGGGYSLKYFLDRNIEGIGVEGFDDAILASPVKSHIVKHDYSSGPYVPEKRYDFAWTCEFVEHVEEKYVDNFMQTVSMCDLVGMTHAVPGQGGYHHVNCQTSEYWINVFKKYNFFYLEEESINLRELQKTNPVYGQWAKNTFMLFKQH